MSDLIDTTEMYLRTIYELIEEDIPPLRARIAERLGHSGPTVSQTVARMERDNLLVVTEDRQIRLTDEGIALAARVMRKHRLAERLLMDVIQLDWGLVHNEACRWEHVISEAVERRLVDILSAPTHSPYGNPIPALQELGVEGAPKSPAAVPVTAALIGQPGLTVVHFSENAQTDADLLASLGAAGLVPGAPIRVEASDEGLTLVGETGECEVPSEAAAHVYVRAGE